LFGEDSDERPRNLAGPRRHDVIAIGEA
jgi:hypothetical protein